MSKRDAALMRRALTRDSTHYAVSPELFAKRHPDMVLYYSARSVRRWLQGEPMPPAVRKLLTDFTSPTE